MAVATVSGQGFIGDPSVHLHFSHMLYAWIIYIYIWISLVCIFTAGGFFNFLRTGSVPWSFVLMSLFCF